MKYCPKCKKDVESPGVSFCPDCRVLLKPKEMEGRKVLEKPLYTEYNPPSAKTVYCKWKNIPFDQFSYDLHSGAVSAAFVIMEQEFKEGTHYFCSNCAYYVDGYCQLKDRDCAEKAICKSYEKRLNPGGNASR